MTESQLKLKNQLIQQAQIHKVNVFYRDEEARRDWLKVTFNVTSFKHLNIDQLKRVVHFLKTGGKEELSTLKQVDYIKKLWIERGRNQNYKALLSFVSRTIGKESPSEIALITKEEATKVILGLEEL
jgi:hypothetical protein